MKNINIKEIRESLGMSQTQFATLLGCHLFTLVRWENKLSEPSPAYEREVKRLLEEIRQA